MKVPEREANTFGNRGLQDVIEMQQRLDGYLEILLDYLSKQQLIPSLEITHSRPVLNTGMFE